MYEIKEIGSFEYMIGFAMCRTPLIDFYLRTKGESCGLLGAFFENRGSGILLYERHLEEWELLAFSCAPGAAEPERLEQSLLERMVREASKKGAASLTMRLFEDTPVSVRQQKLLAEYGFFRERELEIFYSEDSKRENWKRYMNRRGNAVMKLLADEGFAVCSFREAPREAIEEICDRRSNRFDRSLSPREILAGQKGHFCSEISHLSIKDGHPAAYCLMCRPDIQNYTCEMISAAEPYRQTGVIFQAFAQTVNTVITYPFRQVRFMMFLDNKQSFAMTGRVMKRLISGSRRQSFYRIHFQTNRRTTKL